MSYQEKITVDRQLADALKMLAEKHPVEKITIRQITDEAGVIRATFYHHFSDKYRLIEWIMTSELFEPVRPLLKNGMFEEALIVVLSQIEKDAVFYRKVLKMQEPFSFREIFTSCAEAELEMIFQGQTNIRQFVSGWMKPEFVAAYYAQSVSFMITDWMQKGMHLPPKLVAEEYFFLLSHPVRETLGSMAKAE